MVLKIAHRGFSSQTLENSIKAFKKAANSGVDMVEFDVHETKDGHIVVMHDETLDRTTYGKGRIKDFELEEIRKFRTKDGELIPTIQEVIKILKNKCGLNIEVKDKNLTNKILDIIKKEKIENKVMLSSFHSNVVRFIKEREPKIKTAWLVAETKRKIQILYTLRFFLPFFVTRKAKKMKVDAVGLHYTLITNKIVKELHKNSIQVGAWTVNTKEEFNRLENLGVDAIISDYPDILNI